MSGWDDWENQAGTTEGQPAQQDAAASPDQWAEQPPPQEQAIPPEIQQSEQYQQAYLQAQQAYAQAEQAQQMYMQAQQVYQQAQENGQAEQAQQAYAQAEQAQQMYQQAQQAYMYALQQVQAMIPPGQGAPPPQGAPQDPYAQQQQPQDPYAQQQPQDPYAQQQQPQDPYAQQQPQDPYAQQPPEGAMAPQGGSVQLPPTQEAGPSPYAMSEADRYAAQEAIRAAQESGDASSWSQEDLDALDSPIPDEYTIARLTPPSKKKWIFLFLILLFGGGGAGYYYFWVYLPSAQKPLPRTLMTYRENDTNEMSKEERERLRRKLAPKVVKPTPYLRKLDIALKPLKWLDLALAGVKECRSLYLISNKGLYGVEGDIPPDDKDYLRDPDPRDPFILQKIKMISPGPIQLVKGFYHTYALIRRRAGPTWWVVIYPLVGNALQAPNRPKKKRPKDESPRSCGDSDLPSFVLKDKAIAVGDGDCEQALRFFGIPKKRCLTMPVSPKGRVFYFPTGKKFSPQGNLVVGEFWMNLQRKRTPKRTGRNLFYKLKNSYVFSVDPPRKRWIFFHRKTGTAWSIDRSMRVRTLKFTFPQSQNIVGVHFDSRNKMRVVYHTHMTHFVVKGKKLEEGEKFPFGKNFKALQATWGRHGDVLLVRNDLHNVYQFSENP